MCISVFTKCPGCCRIWSETDLIGIAYCENRAKLQQSYILEGVTAPQIYMPCLNNELWGNTEYLSREYTIHKCSHEPIYVAEGSDGTVIDPKFLLPASAEPTPRGSASERKEIHDLLSEYHKIAKKLQSAQCKENGGAPRWEAHPQLANARSNGARSRK